MKTKTTQHNAGECTTSSIVETVTRPDGHRALSPRTEQQLLQELASRNLQKPEKLNGKPGSDRNRMEPKQRNITGDNYLSIDMDFWAHSRVDKDFLRRVIRCVGAANVAAAIEHDSILAHTRRYANDCTVLINVDSHSDLGGVVNVMFENGDCDDRRLELHSGSWADYIAWPVRQEFCWIYPDFVSREEGRCDAFSEDVPFSQIPQREPLPGVALDYKWRNLRRHLAQPPDYGIDLDRVRAASIALSPDCCGPDAVEAFQTLVREFNLELLDVLAPNLAALKASMAQVEKETPSQTPKDYGPVPLHANPQDVLSVKDIEDPESKLNFRPHFLNSRKGPLREMLCVRCWAEGGAPPVGSLISAKGAWYDVQSDAPVDGSQDRAECPTRLWKVISCDQFPSHDLEPGRPYYCIEAAGQFIEQYVIYNKRGAEGVARRMIGAA